MHRITLIEFQFITFFISGQPSFTSGLSLDDLGEESPALKRAHDALMAACGLGPKPKPSHEAPTEAAAEIQPEEASVSPKQPHFIPSFSLPDAPLLSSTLPSLFPSAPYSSPFPHIHVDSPTLF